MSDLKFEFDDKEVLRKLQAVRDAPRGRILVNGCVAGAMVIEREWKDLMLVEPTTYRTGQYRRSVHNQVLESSPTRAVVIVATDIDDPPYPKFLEFGTSRMAARPKARPAYDRKKDEATETAGEVIKQQVLREAAR